MGEMLETTARKADASSHEALGGDLIHEYTAQFTELTDYGVTLDALLAGEAAPPPEGARFGIAYAGVCLGARAQRARSRASI